MSRPDARKDWIWSFWKRDYPKTSCIKPPEKNETWPKLLLFPITKMDSCFVSCAVKVGWTVGSGERVD